MFHFPSAAAVLRTGRLHYVRNGVARPLAAAGLMLAIAGPALAQSGAAACGSYQSLCQGRPKPGLCAQLQQRCGGSADGAASIQPHGDQSLTMPQLDNPTDMPDCTKDQELVMVPTCQCESALDTAGSGDNACGTCTTDGVRMECQNAH